MTKWTALFDSVRTRWRRAAPVSQRPVAVRIERPRSRVPDDYLPLYTYLERRYASIVVLTFEQMESLLGFALPLPAGTEQDWWSAAAGLPIRHAGAWMEAGRTATPNLSARTVRFERIP